MKLTLPTIKGFSNGVFFYQGNLTVAQLKAINNTEQTSCLSSNIICVPELAKAETSEVELEFREEDFYSVHMIQLDIDTCFKNISIDLSCFDDFDYIPVIFVKSN